MCGDVGQAVRGERHAVDDHPGTDRVGQGRDPADVVLLADDVRRMRDRHEPGPLGQQRLEVGDVQQPGVGVGPPLLHRAADAGRSSADRSRVGLVILIGDDHLMTGFEHLGEGVGEYVGVRRRRRPEDHLAWLHPQRLGPPCPRAVHQRSRTRRRLELAVGLDLQVRVVRGQRVDRLAAGEGSPGVLEERLALVDRAGEGGKVRADEVEVEHTATVVPSASTKMGP